MLNLIGDDLCEQEEIKLIDLQENKAKSLTKLEEKTPCSVENNF